MSGIQLFTDALFLAIFVITLAAAVRRRRRTNLDIAAFFGSLAFVVVLNPLASLLSVKLPPAITDIAISLVVALPYLMLRLLADFSSVPRWLLRAALAGLALAVVAVFLAPPQLPPALVLAIVAYFVGLTLYCAVAFVRFARRSPGVTRRRMQAIAAGNLLLALAVLGSGASSLIGGTIQAVTGDAVQVLALGSALAWYLGFATPAALRRYWQEPELRAFLRRATELPRLPDAAAIVRELEHGAATSLGARASIGLWDVERGVLRYAESLAGLPPEMGVEESYPSSRAFKEQRAMFFADAATSDPTHAPAYRAGGVGPMLVAPINAGDQRLGLLRVYAERMPIFSDDDLDLVRLLADQAAVILESRALIDEAARVRAHEEAAKLKDDFISAAAHDLKTPLTALLGQAQILERKFERDASRREDLPAVARITAQARRLGGLVEELLDAARVDQGRLELRREPAELDGIVRQVATASDPAFVHVDAPAAVKGRFDVRRIEQLMSNLLENARKYSPNGAPVEVAVWAELGEARISVRDRGIGIPQADLPFVFDRFWRAGNVNDRQYAGLGLGLYICRGIAEQHGGRIWVESVLGEGATFHVALPIDAEGVLHSATPQELP